MNLWGILSNSMSLMKLSYEGLSNHETTLIAVVEAYRGVWWCFISSAEYKCLMAVYDLAAGGWQ